ncbi:hypothetical protein [Polyangium jinanense]|nr:hypothetical protein [Polyangium jinanense]
MAFEVEPQRCALDGRQPFGPIEPFPKRGALFWRGRRVEGAPLQVSP